MAEDRREVVQVPTRDLREVEEKFGGPSAADPVESRQLTDEMSARVQEENELHLEPEVPTTAEELRELGLQYAKRQAPLHPHAVASDHPLLTAGARHRPGGSGTPPPDRTRT